jgi:hypothetical protein
MSKLTLMQRLTSRLDKLKKHEQSIELCYKRLYDLAVEWAKDHKSLQPAERDRSHFQIIKYIGREPLGMRVSVIDVQLATNFITMFCVGTDKKTFTDSAKAETYFIQVFAKVINETA